MARVCSECGASLAGRPPATKTCSERCRQIRSRRQRAEHRKVLEAKAAEDVSLYIQQNTERVVAKVMRDEIQPVVREALTEEVLQAVKQMVGLSGRMVARLAEDIEDEDPTVRQRAYALLAKYTIGHPAILQHTDTQPDTTLNVSFELPRPAVPVDAEADSHDYELMDEDVRACDMCGQVKKASEFVANSERCAACQDAWRRTILAEHGAS